MWIISSTLSLSTEKPAAPAKPPGSTVVCVHAVSGGLRLADPGITTEPRGFTEGNMWSLKACVSAAFVATPARVSVPCLCLSLNFVCWRASPAGLLTRRAQADTFFPDVACCRNEPDFWSRCESQFLVPVPCARLLSPVCSFGSTLSSWQWRLSCPARSARCHEAGRPVFGPKKLHRFRDHQNSSTGHVCPRCDARKHGRYPSLTDIVFVRRHAKKGTALHDGVGSLMFFFFSSDSRASKDAN